jgi:RNA recognition motif-containing protein
MCGLLCQLVFNHEILCVFPQNDKWLIEFTNFKSAQRVMEGMHGLSLGDNQIYIEWAKDDPLSLSKADFDVELRLQCLANYWDPPIFIYGRILQSESIQTCAVIMRDTRKNVSVSIFIEINFADLHEIQSRICEIIMHCIDECGGLPTYNVVLKSFNSKFCLGKI